MEFMNEQKKRPQDNNIEFWRMFVSDYFAPSAKMRWCVSSYGQGGRQPAGVFPQDSWQCQLCGATPARGFEMSAEVLPRLFKIKFDSGLSEETLSLDLPLESLLPSGRRVLDCQKAVQQSLYEGLRIVRTGQLRVVFTADLKMLSWDFCTSHHEELIPRRPVLQQVSHLANLAHKWEQQSSSLEELHSQCGTFGNMCRALALKLDSPPVNDLGFTKCYVRCLQISEVVNSMKDLIDFTQANQNGPISALQSFPRRPAVSPGLPTSPGQDQGGAYRPHAANLGMPGGQLSRHSVSPSGSLSETSAPISLQGGGSNGGGVGGFGGGGMGRGMHWAGGAGMAGSQQQR